MNETFNWKNAKNELPKEAAHTDVLWCSQNVLARYKSFNNRYIYRVCWYDFEGKRFRIAETDKLFPADEWCELEIFA